jgi:DUF971 family protein
VTTPSGDAARPADIVVDLEEGLMRIDWLDGHESLYELAALRAQCPCAVCKGEMGVPGQVREDTTFSEEQTKVLEMREVGRYALQPIWADGHETGLYTFRLLRALCPCPFCVAEHA